MNDNELAPGHGPLPTGPGAAPPLDATSSVSSGGGLLAVIERLATSPNLNIDVFERLLNMRRQEEDRAAERAFNAAISLAKGELSPVLKTNTVDYSSAKGRTRYKYESMADVARVVDPVFSKHGLAYRFSNAQTGDLLQVTCIVSHADGFSERTVLQSKVDAGGTGMNAVQALGSALTYLQRYSLRAAIGLAAAIDDDGRGGGGAPKITDEQRAELEKLFVEARSGVLPVLKLVGVEEIADMNVDQWKRAIEVLTVAKAERTRRDAPRD